MEPLTIFRLYYSFTLSKIGFAPLLSFKQRFMSFATFESNSQPFSYLCASTNSLFRTPKIQQSNTKVV